MTIEAGQVWVEKTKRQEYPEKRVLRVLSVGEPERSSHAQGGHDITLITFEIRTSKQRAFWGPGDGLWTKSKRTMYAFGLHKNWELKK